MPDSQANHHIAAMAPYAVADLSAGEGVPLISLAQNESFRAPSPHAIVAGQRALESGALYPDPDYPELRAAIASQHEVDPELILCGAGSMELITCITQAFAGPGRRVLSSQYGYALFANSAQKVMAPYDVAEEENLTVSVDRLLAAVTSETKVLFVANPGNPTGTRLPNAELIRLRGDLPDHVILVVDEAYGEFADADDAPLVPLVEQGNTIILRTFSKAYGLAAARAGWGLFPPHLGGEVRKLIIPSSIGSISAEMARAAMEDQEYMRETCVLTSNLLADFQRRISSNGLICTNSRTNFVLIQFPSVADAQSADRALREVGIVMRGMGGYGLPHCLRATIADQPIMQLAGDTLESWAKGELS